jgi:anti-sigma B factor antagonist
MGEKVDEQLQIEVRNGTEPVEVSLIGDVDVATEARVVEALSALAAQEVIVDLSQVGFLDSSGIRALVVGHRASEAAGGSLALRGPSSEAAQVLELTRINEVIRVVD